MFRGLIFFLMSILYSMFCGYAMHHERNEDGLFGRPRFTLKNICAKYVAARPAFLKGKMPPDVHELVSESVLIDRIKPALFPISLPPENQRSMRHFGVCGLQEISEVKQIVSADCGGKITFCDENDLVNCQVVQSPSDPRCVTLVAKGQEKKLIVGNVNGHITIWDAVTRKMLKDFGAHCQQVNAVSVSPSKVFYVSSAIDSLIKIWTTKNDDLRALLKGHTSSVKNAYLRPGDSQLVSAGFDHTMRTWDVEKEQIIHTYDVGNTMNLSRMVMHPSGQAAMAGLNFGIISLWDVREKNSSNVLLGHTQLVSDLACSLDGNYLISGSWDETVRLWDLRMLRSLATMIGHKNWVQSVSSFPDFNTAFSGSRDGSILKWDLSSIMSLDKLSFEQRISAAQQIEKDKPTTNMGRLSHLLAITKK